MAKFIKHMDKEPYKVCGPTKDCSFREYEMPLRYTDILQTIKTVYKTEGAIAFTKGVLPRMCINIPATALSWGTYELIKGLISPYVD